MNHMMSLLVVLLTLCGCQTGEQLHERGWIGGEYVRVSEDGKIGDPIILSRMYPESPIALAGLKEGDQIVSVDNETFWLASDLHKMVDHYRPGQVILVNFRRGEDIREVEVVVGREIYKKRMFFRLGFRVESTLRLWPPSVFNLIGYDKHTKRRQMASPVVRVFMAEDSSELAKELWQEKEGLSLPLVGFHVKYNILSQEAVPRE